MLINKFYDVRAGEWFVTTIMFFINFLLMVVLYFLKPARDSLFLVELGANQLPLVFILVAVASIPITQFVTLLVRKYNNFSVFLWTNLFVILNLLIIRGLFWIDQDWVYTLFYIWVSVYSILIISQFWVYANELYNTNQSKRLFSLINLGAILGAIAGSQFSSLAVSYLDIQTENLLFVCAGTILLIIGLVYTLKDKSKFSSEKEDESKSSLDAIKNTTIFRSIFKSKYQLIIAGIIGIAMLISTLVDYQLKAIAADAYPDKAGLTAFMGTFYAGLSIASLFIQILFSGRILRKMGVGGALSARPIGMLIGSVLMIFEPVLAVAVFLGGFDGATQYSIDKTSREILFLPLSQEMKERVKFFMDVFVDRFFRGIAGFILLLLVFWGDTSVQQLAWLVTALILVWLFLTWLARNHYIDQFRQSLRNRYIDIDSIGADLNDPTTVRLLRDALKSDNSRKIHHVLKLMEGQNLEQFSNELRNLLKHKSSEIRVQAIRLLTSIKSKNFSDEILELLNEKDTELRLESIHYICQNAKKNPEEILNHYLSSSDHSEKAAAMGCISKYGSEMEKEKMISNDLIESIIKRKEKNSNLARAQVAQVLKYLNVEKAKTYLPVLLTDPSPAVRTEAIKSIKEVKDDSFIPLLINRLNDDKSSYEVRMALASYGPDYINLFTSYYHSGDFPMEICYILPLLLADIQHQKSVDELLNVLKEEKNPTQRKNIIKGLNKLRDSEKVFDFDRERVDKELNKEIKSYYELFAVLHVIPDEKHCGLIKKAIQEKLELYTEDVFRLLGLIYDHQDIYNSYLAYKSINEEKRAKGIELLENILEENHRSRIFPILDSANDDTTIKAGKSYYSVSIDSRKEAILNLLNGNDPWLKSTAIYSSVDYKDENIKEEVKKALNHHSDMVRETAELVLKKSA